MQTMDSSLTGDLAQLVSELVAVEEDADAIIAGLDDEQFNWSPAPRVWSIAQCLDHLNITNALYVAGIRPALEEARARGLRRAGPIAVSWWGRRFVGSLEPPARLKMKTPRAIVPGARKRKAEVWPEFVRIHGQIRACIEENADLDLNGARMRNPLFGLVWMRVGTALRAIAAHDRRHIWQARAVRNADGFPRS